MNFVLPFIFPKSITTAIASISQPPIGKLSGKRSQRRRLTPISRWAFLLAVFLVACTPNLGGDNLGWSPISVQFSSDQSGPAQVFVAAPMAGSLDDLGERLGLDLGDDEKKVKILALEDFSSGLPSVAWTYPALGSGLGLEGVFGPPAVSSDLDLVFVSAVDGHLYAISRDTGSDATGWKKAVRDDPSRDPLPLISGPVLTEITLDSGGRTPIVLVGSEDGGLYGFNAATGEELDWSPFLTGGKIWSTPAIFNGIAYIGSHDHFIYAFDLRDGRELWRFETGGAVVSTPLVVDGLAIAGSFDKKLYALDADDGGLEWEFEGSNWFWAGAATDGETIFAPSMDGNVYALDISAPPPGEVKESLWRHNMGSPIVSTPTLVPLGLVVAAVDGRMRLLSTNPADLEQGEVISNLPSLEQSGIKAPLAAGTAPIPSGIGPDLSNLSVIQRHSVFVGGDNGIARRIVVTEGQDKESLWCYDATRHEPCN